MKHVLLDDGTYEIAAELARRRGMSVEEVVHDAIRAEAQPVLVGAEKREDSRSIIRCLSDEPELVDFIIETAMESRSRPMRLDEE